MNSFVCLICGYVYVGESAPDHCPICDAPKDMFEKEEINSIQVENNAFRCLNCEYIHEGNEPPAFCPVCGFSKEHFEAIQNIGLDSNAVDFEKVVVLGGGIAALSAVETLRNINQDISITMITGEEKLPYYRLNLTRFLCDDIDEAELCIHSQYWYDEKRINIVKNRVIIDIDNDGKQITLDDDIVIDYDKLIIALGSHPFIPPINGVNQPGVYSLRSIEDAKEIKASLPPGASVFVIGGGVLGLEAAGALNKNKVNVTVAEGSSWLMPRQLNEGSAKVLHNYITDAGIAIEYSFMTTEIRKVGNQFEVMAHDGRLQRVDIVIMATGVRANTYLARKAGLEVNNGIVVNDHLLTSDEHIYAIGDISEHYGVVYGLWNIAQYQGKIAAMNLLGERTPFGGVPRSNALKVLDIDVFSIGTIKHDDASYELIEKSDESSYIMFTIHDGVVIGSIAIGYKDITHKIKKLVESGHRFSYSEIDTLDKILNKL